MKIASWNLNHRTIEKPIPDAAGRFLAELGADIISMSEYVDGLSRDTFKDDLKKAGYTHQLISPRIGKNNQIFIGSKHPLQIGDLTPPSLTDAATTNFLHVKLAGKGFEFIGIRAPAYKLTSERTEYWRQFGGILRSAAGRSLVAAGDLNHDPFLGATSKADSIAFKLAERFTIPNPKGTWSYISIDGKKTSRIDHAIVSEKGRVLSAEYLTEWKGLQLAGSKEMAAITDHAVLVFDIEV